MLRDTTLGNARRAWRAPRRSALAALAIGAALGLAASPARAGNEFKNGFEDQIGRLLAFEVFHAGHLILGAPVYRSVTVVRPVPRPVYVARSWRHGHRHHHHHDEPCDGERDAYRGRRDVVVERYEVRD
jgi:hypothetical protein